MANDPGEAVRDNYRKQGAEAELERITKLLEAVIAESKEGDWAYYVQEEFIWIQMVANTASPHEWIPMLIDFIKGKDNG